MKKTLDLCFHGTLDPEISDILQKISYSLRSEFNDFIAEISDPNKNNLDWWVQGPASRNTYSSPLFHYYTTLHLLSHLGKDNNLLFKEIIVDSPAFKEIVNVLLIDIGAKECKVSSKNRFRGTIKNNLLMPWLFFVKFSQMVLARMILDRDDALSDQPLTLIDTFIMPGYIKNDRWYGSLWDNLSASQRRSTYFIPTIVLTPLSKISSVFKSAKKDVRNFLFKENYINYKDILFAVGHRSRIVKIKIKPIKVVGCDISKLIKEELRNNSDMMTVVESILTYRFIQRIKQLDVKVKLAIDWYEGQSLDKAWNLGFNEFHPKTKTIGYRAFEGFPFYLCAYPIPIEKEAHVLPSTFAVQGEATISTVREVFPSVDVIVIPAFKAQYVWSQSNNVVDKSKHVILITLPISMRFSSEIINRIAKSYHLFNNIKEVIQFVIKPHPTHFIDNIKNCLPEWPKQLLLSKEKSIARLLYISDILITEASSTCLEALACGIPVILMENRGGITYDPIPENVSSEMYKKIKTQQELITAIQYYLSQTELDRKQQKVEGLKIRERYFEPITNEGVNRLLQYN